MPPRRVPVVYMSVCVCLRVRVCVRQFVCECCFLVELCLCCCCCYCCACSSSIKLNKKNEIKPKVSQSVFGFWCFHARAASHAPECCAAAARVRFSDFAVLSVALTVAVNTAPVAAALIMCSHALSKPILSPALSVTLTLPCTILFLCVCERARLRMYVSMCRVHMHAHIFTAMCVRVCACLCFIFYLFSLMRQRNAIKTRPVWCDIDEISPMHISFAPERIINLLFVSVVKNALLFLRFQFDDVRFVGLRSLLLFL